MRGEAAHKQSTYNGMFLSEEDIQDLFLDLCPTCACVGMRDFLCNGKRPLSEIEQEIFRLHPKLFKIAAEAATFVAEVVTRYSR